MGKFDNRRDFDIDTKFDMKKKPQKQKWYLHWLINILCLPTFNSKRHKVKKINLDGLKPPYLLLCNHNSFIDFKIATKATYPYKSNYVVALDGFIKREGLLRDIGCICKRKFTNDTQLVRHMLYALKNFDQIMMVFPEARYSLCGTSSMLPKSLGKFIKLAKVPVCVLIAHGNHLSEPFWHQQKNNIPTQATIKKIYDAYELETISVDEINERLKKEFEYDDFKWQQENKILIDKKNRAEGLHRILYKCPHCNKEFNMESTGSKLICPDCGSIYTLTEYGEIKSINRDSLFHHIPDWFEWERKEVLKEIKKGTYKIEDDVMVDTLANSKGFVNLGKGHLVHDCNGFVFEYFVNGAKKIIVKEPLSMFGCHIEYNYNSKGDCIEISTLDDTFYLYFINKKNVVTKIHFATEELYKLNSKDNY